MTQDDVAVTIAKIAREVFGQASVEFSHGLVFREILGFDSIRAIQYILAIEKAFCISLNEKEVDNMHTMGDLLQLLSNKG